MAEFTPAQIDKIEKLFEKLSENLKEQAGSDYSRNDAAKEALHNAAYAVDSIEVRWELEHT